MFDFRIHGYCRHTSFMTCEGEVAGSGHILTEKGKELQEDLKIETKVNYSC